jgi:hypothetical protein
MLLFFPVLIASVNSNVPTAQASSLRLRPTRSTQSGNHSLYLPLFSHWKRLSYFVRFLSADSLLTDSACSMFYISVEFRELCLWTSVLR